MKCLGSLIFVLTIATKAWASGPVVSTPPSPCPQPKSSVEQIKTQKSSAEKPRKSSAQILTPLKRPDPIVPLGCERPFTYQGETYSVDSPQSQNAANLKYFTSSVPESNELLSKYQSNRKKTELNAYIGTAIFIMGVFALPIARRFERSSSENAEHLSEVLRYSAIVLGAADLTYTFSLLHDNETLIPKAVDSYNRAHPKDPIELRFSAGWSF